jgi:hypothetical protein
MNTTQDSIHGTLDIAAHDLRDAAPALVEALSIDELAVREEYSACYTVK